MAITTYIRDKFNKISAAVSIARSGVGAISVKIEDMNTNNFALPVVSGAFGTPNEEALVDELTGLSAEMNVDGDTTPVIFRISALEEDWLVDELYLYAQDGGVKYSNFLGLNAPLTNGLLVEVKANDQLFTSTIKSTAEFLAWSSGVNFFRGSDAGGDVVKAAQTSGFTIRKAGTFGPAANDDYIKVTVRDTLLSVNQLRGAARGVFRDV